MNNYELTIILRTNDVDGLKEKANEILQKYGAKITSEDPWGVKKLAYEIDGEKEGYYQFLNVESSPDSIEKISHDFKLNSNFLRYLFVNLSKNKSE